MPRRPIIAALTAAAAGFALVACAPAESETDTVTIGVAVAPSLAGAFSELISVFETEHPGTRVNLELGRSGELAESLGDRTDVNVFASASETAMDLAVAAGTVTNVQVFARNHVVLAVPSGNPADVTGLADLSRPELKVGLCDEVLPCGIAADLLLGEAGMDPGVEARNGGSRALSARLADNEVDAGIIYRTDVAASVGWVSQVAVDEHERKLTQEAGAIWYSLARVPGGERDGEDGESAREIGGAFRDLVTSERGRVALENAGLQPLTA